MDINLLENAIVLYRKQKLHIGRRHEERRVGAYICSVNEMDKRIRKIYCELIKDMTDEDEISKWLRKEVTDLLQSEKGEMEKQEYEKYRDKAFLFASAGEEAGFVRGFRYAFGLFMECMHDKD